MGEMSKLFTLIDTVSARLEVKKSRFVAVAGPVADEAAARAFIDMHAERTANHNCWAWRVGQNYRFSDDGEPGGTAGKPILQAIDGQSLDNVAVVVTRWFGGVLLGSGGLMRAYGGTAASCLHEAARKPLVETLSATVACGFSDLSLVQSRLEAVPDAKLHAPRFNESGAELSFDVPKDAAFDIERLLADLTAGRARVQWNG